MIGSGVYVLRGSDVTNYLSFLGVTESAQSTKGQVETGEQRSLLLWMGWQMWRTTRSSGSASTGRTPASSPISPPRAPVPGRARPAYPSKANPWGVQNYWLQLASDVGIVGFVLGVATFLVGLVLAFKGVAGDPFAALVAAGFILVAAGTWNAIGIVPGVPLEALTWIGLGLGAAALPLAETGLEPARV